MDIMNDDERIRFTLRLSDYLYGKISSEASKKGVTKNAAISEILWQYFKSKDRVSPVE